MRLLWLFCSLTPLLWERKTCYFTLKSGLPASIPTVFTLSCLLFSALWPAGPMGRESCCGIQSEAGYFLGHPIRSGRGRGLFCSDQSVTADVSLPLKTLHGALTVQIIDCIEEDLLLMLPPYLTIINIFFHLTNSRAFSPKVNKSILLHD